MSKNFLKKIKFSLVALFLVLSFILTPISLITTFGVSKVHADADDGANIASLVENGISAAGTMIQTGLMTSLNVKEFTLDAIAWALGNILLKEMIRSTTKWVNSGFQGSPAFVTDLQGFLLNIGDKVAGNFIYGAGLGALCSPFKLNIQFALDLSYQRTRGYEAQCRLSQVVGNMDRFLGGDFAQGGWDGWYEVALTDSNPYATKLAAESAMYASISNAQGQQVKLLDFGRGFMSMQDPGCDTNMGPCPVTTPGAVIESQLNSAISSPGRRLEVADELNELVGALFSQLASAALSGAGGLLGLTESSYGSGDYFTRMSEQRDTSGGLANTSIKPLENDIVNENKFVSLKNTIVTLINDAETYKARTYPPRIIVDAETRATSTLTCPGGALPQSLIQTRSAAQADITLATSVINDLNVLKSDYAQLQSASTPTSTILSLKRKYRADSVPLAEANLIDAYGRYQASGNLHGVNVLVPLELRTIPDLRTEISSFTASIDAVCRSYFND
jgi:hypothetical protein